MNTERYYRELERLRIRAKAIWDTNREDDKCGKCGAETAIGKNGRRLTHCEKHRQEINARTKDVVIKRATSAKLLGIVLDDKLFFKEYITSVANELSYASYALLKLKTSYLKTY